MITAAIILIFYGILKGILAILPPMTVLPDEWVDMWTWFGTGIANWMYLMPNPIMLATIPIAIIAFEIAYWSFILSMFIFDKIRG